MQVFFSSQWKAGVFVGTNSWAEPYLDASETDDCSNPKLGSVKGAYPTISLWQPSWWQRVLNTPLWAGPRMGKALCVYLKEEPNEGKQMEEEKGFYKLWNKEKDLTSLALGLRQMMTFKSQLLPYQQKKSCVGPDALWISWSYYIS